jgi:Xaa-Pro aminopeptidase
MSDVLIYGDTFRTPELRHEVPVGIPDPFLYLEADGVSHVQISSMEVPRLGGIERLELHPPEEFGYDELRVSGLPISKIRDELHTRAVQRFGITSAVVPNGFPLRLADVLRAAGVELTTDQDFFDERRRVKNAAELAGIRRAQKAAEVGMSVARDLLRSAIAGEGGLVAGGEPLTVERIKAAMGAAFIANGTTFDEFVVSHGPQAAIAHHMGEGRIQPDESIVIDVWPKDNETSCYADMTRTFVVGWATDEVREWYRLVKEALMRAVADVRAGVTGRAVFDGTCDIFEGHGYPTQRTKQPGVTLEEGFFHGLGHGVGLEVHEAPGMGLASKATLEAGDVVTVEPGLYRPGVGGVRLEDLLLVTDGGAENLTSFPYDLTP